MKIFTIEKLSECSNELIDLIHLHFSETPLYEDIPLLPNWPLLFNLEESGHIKFFTIREDNKLIGYSLITLFNSLLYRTSFQANYDSIFIHPDHRGFVGLKFIKWCDEELKKLNVQVIFHHTKFKKDYGVLLKRLGYDNMNIEYCKRLDL